MFYYAAMSFNLADCFEAVADAIPGREALVCNGRRLTYAQLDERANRLAAFLSQAGIGHGDHVGMYLYNGTEYVEGMLACLKIRAVPINVNYRYVEDELRYLFDDAELKGIIHQRELSPRIHALRDVLPRLRVLVHVDDDSGAATDGSTEFEDALKKGSAERPEAARSPDDLFIIYTGGTTGMPKGVMWRQEDLFHTGLGSGNPMGVPVASAQELAANAVARDPQIVQFPVPPLIHGAAQLAVFIGLNWGDKVVLVPKFDANAVWDAVQNERVNTITIVGDAMARPMADALAANPGRWDTSSLAYLGSTGALMSDGVKQTLQSMLPNTFVTSNFGATETGHQGMEMPGVRPEGGGLRFFMKPTTMVLDDDLQPVQPGSGVVGRLAISGHIPLGYWRDEEKTKATFHERDGMRFAIPGDMATVDADGSVIVFGRGSVCINSGGEKIYPEEVEDAVRGAPGVYDAVVVGQRDERWGERVVAIVQPQPGATPSLEEIVEFCRTKIAGYKVPRAMKLVEQVQRQPSGKPDYPWAKALVANGD